MCEARDEPTWSEAVGSEQRCMDRFIMGQISNHGRRQEENVFKIEKNLFLLNFII